MDDTDLDKYLEDLGIDMTEESEAVLPDDLEGSGERPAREEDDSDSDSVSVVEEAPSSRHVTISAAPLDGTAADRCETFLVDVLLNFDPSYSVEVREGDDELQAEVYGGDPGKVIGRNGRTLAALEFITNAVINREEGDPHTRVSIDVGGYKRRRDERLRNEANKAAARVRKTGYAVELDTMTAAERRVVHMALAEAADVVSESHGEGKNRRVVVKPA